MSAPRDRKILPLGFRLLGAESMEEALFRGYLRQVRELHPDAPLPALHQSDGILADAERLRARDGDERFLAGLNGTPDGGGPLPGPGRGAAVHRAGGRAAARATAFHGH